MFIETPWLEHPNLQGICFHSKSGDFLIRKNAEKKVYDEYKSIQFLEICCRWMNIEFNYLFDVKHYNCVGGKKLGLKPSLYNKDNPIIIIRKSSRDRISFKKNYSQILKSDYIINYDENLAEKLALIKSGDYKE